MLQRSSLEMQDPKSHHLDRGHHRTTLSSYIFATKGRFDNPKKNLLSSSISYMSPRYAELGPLAAEIGPVVWGTRANFNGFRILLSLL